MKDSTRQPMLTVVSVSLLVVVALGLGVLPAFIRTPFNGVVHADPTKDIKYTGADSCSSTQCHGAAKSTPTFPGDCGHNENTVYFKKDKHAIAFTSKDGKKGLNNELSKKIAANLGIKNAAESQRCLICHSLSGFSNETKSRIELNYVTDIEPGALAAKKFSVKQGVNCDGCHGPSAKYLEPHVEKGWTNKQRAAIGSEKLFDQWGLYDTKNLKMRANSCVSCHLKIDPELIKADHPELPFELDTFSHGEWMHWSPSPDYYGAKAWAMGQFVCLREAAVQLAERIKAGDKVDAGLKADSYKQLTAHLLMARHPAKLIAPEMEAELNKQLDVVINYKADAGKAEAALRAMGKTADALADKLNPIKLDAGIVQKMLANVAAEGEVATARGYRAAQQYYYAMTALWETSFLKGAAPDADPKAMNAKTKGDANTQKILELAGLVETVAEFKAPNFLKIAKEVMGAIPGGAAIALPATGPDFGGASMAIEAVAPPVTPPVTPPSTPVVITPPPVTPPVIPPVTPPVTPPSTPVVVTPPVTPPITPPVTPPVTPTVVAPGIPSPPLQLPASGKSQFCPECGRKFPFEFKYCPVEGTKLLRIEN